MAVIALNTANKVEIVESNEQLTLPAAEAVVAGNIVRLDVTNGRFTKANGSSAAEARVYGVAVKTVAAGEPVTAIRRGVMDGWDLSALAYDAPVYASNTDGAIDSAAGTVSTEVGRVIPATGNLLGVAHDKILLVECP